MYVASSFQAEVLAHDFGLLCCVSWWVVSSFEADVLVHDFDPLVFHQDVCDVVL
jgi:hypothetical protein